MTIQMERTAFLVVFRHLHLALRATVAVKDISAHTLIKLLLHVLLSGRRELPGAERITPVRRKHFDTGTALVRLGKHRNQVKTKSIKRYRLILLESHGKIKSLSESRLRQALTGASAESR